MVRTTSRLASFSVSHANARAVPSSIIQGIEIDDYSRGKIKQTLKELTDEAEAVKDML
jgi:hypothetical protein